MSARSELTRAARLHEAAARAMQRTIQLNEEHIAYVEQQQAKQAGSEGRQRINVLSAREISPLLAGGSTNTARVRAHP